MNFSIFEKLIRGLTTLFSTYLNTAMDGTKNMINNQHDYVDLGLPSGTLWADKNVGAKTETEYGDYFAWGEIETKEEYIWKTYKCNIF